MSATVQGIAGLTVAEPAPPPRRREILCVQTLRGVAVLMVLLVHVEDMANRIPYFEHLHTWYAARVGYSGPDLFFVISGFIMSYITFGMPFDPRHWAINRFARIYPMYFLFTSLALAILLLRPGQPVMGSGPHDAWTVIQSFLILPQGGLPLLFVTWTVAHEVVFYVIVFLVAITMPARMLVWVLVALSGLAMGRWALVHLGGFPDWNWNFPSLFLIQFAIGSLIYQFREPMRRLAVWPAALLSGVFLAIGVMFADSGGIGTEPPFRVVVFGIGYGFMLLAFLNHEERSHHRTDAARRPFAVRVGDASYTLYLCHPFILAAFGHTGRMLNLTGWAAWAWLPLAYVTVIATGMLLYTTLEKPSIGATRRALLRWTTREATR